MSFSRPAAERADVSNVMAAILSRTFLWNRFSLARYVIVLPFIIRTGEGRP
jgi:hypothetical protein